MISLLKTKWPLFLLIVLAVVGCKKDDDGGDGPGTDVLAASFDFTVSADNFLEVKFDNFSANETSNSWDFGDGNTSTEESPTNTYAAAGSYTVVLTASDGTDSKTQTKTVVLTDPNVQSTILAGTGSKTWYLQREGVALGIGGGVDMNNFWAFGVNTPLNARPCVLDDAITFNSDGTVVLETNNTLFIDAAINGGWLEESVAEGCHDEDEAGIFTSAAGADQSAYKNGGSYTYVYDASASTLTVDGAGFYVGLAQKTSAADAPAPIASKTYEVFRIATGTVADTLKLSLNSGAGTNSWNFYMVSYHNPADLPAVPGGPTAGFSVATEGLDATFTNTSANATSYSWDFGDGGSSMDENPVYSYATDGTYTVTLTATDAMGESDMTSSDVTVSTAVFDASVLSNAAGKVWKLDGANSYFVGSSIGANDYWPGVTADDVVTRACQFDDEFIFTDGGVMEFDSKGAVWSEDYMLGGNECVNDGDIPSPYEVLGSGTHAFTASASEITVTGDGAYIGFSKPYNGAELDGVVAPASSITYEVFSYAATGTTEILTVAVDYGGGNYWTMRMISEN